MSRADAPTAMDRIGPDLLEIEGRNRIKPRDFSWIYEALHEIVAVHLHQARGPLTAISGWAQVLDQAAADPLLVAEAAGTIQTAVAEQSAHLRVMDDLLAIARGEKLERDALPAGSLLREACEACMPEAQDRGVQLSWSGEAADGESPEVDARLREIVIYRIRDAIVCSAEGGRVRAELVVEGESVIFRISDTGATLVEPSPPAPWERLRRASEEPGNARGFQLAMAHARAVVEDLGGTLAAWSPRDGDGFGATFAITIPLPDGENSA